MKRHVNELLRTSSGRLAGSGILYDRYDDESILSKNTRKTNPIGTIEYSEYLEELKNQSVKVYKLTKEEMEEYLRRRNKSETEMF